MIDREVLWANIRVGTDALRIHPLRTLLSVLGITIGSAALVATMAVSDGMTQFARGVVLRECATRNARPGDRSLTSRSIQGSRLSPGLYFVRLQAGHEIATARVSVIR